MKTLLASLMTLALFCAMTVAFAAEGDANAPKRDNPLQNATTVTLTGTIKLNAEQQARGEVAGQFVSGDKTYRLVLAPAAYMDKIGAKITDGAQITVTGLLVEREKISNLLACTLTIGDKTYTLRNEKGAPAWTPIDITPISTITGTVKEINAGGEVRVVLTTAAGDVQVSLAPATYIVEQGIALTVGLQLTVTGWQPAAANAKTAMIAQSMVIGDKTYTLRDANGKGVWIVEKPARKEREKREDAK